MPVDDAQITFRAAVETLANRWQASGLPSRQALDEAALKLKHLREHSNLRGLWEDPPRMLTATLDDGLGQGLMIIDAFAAAIGMRVTHLGLMQTPAAIMDACRRLQPDFLGMTILQFDSEDDLVAIAENLPAHTRIVAGGPVFAGDAELADRAGIHCGAKNVTDFLRFMLDKARITTP